MIALTILTAALAGCARQSDDATEAEPQPGPRVVIQAHGLEIAALPLGLRVVTNQGQELVLAPSDTELDGRMELEVEDQVAGVNLYDAVQAHQAEIEGLPGGEYKGAQELRGPLGTAFWSRGTYQDGDVPTEQTCVFEVHPARNALVSLCYTYPAGDDSSDRVQQLLDVVGELGPATQPQ